jgi:hypothetical protein
MEKMLIENGTHELWFEPKLETQEINVFLFDPFNETRTRLITWRGNNGKLPGGEWLNEHMDHKDLFFRLAKEYKQAVKARMNRCKKYLHFNGEGDHSFSTTWKCFKRRVSIQIYKLIK